MQMEDKINLLDNWKTVSTFWQMEDNLKILVKWKMTSKKMEDDLGVLVSERI